VIVSEDWYPPVTHLKFLCWMHIPGVGRGKLSGLCDSVSARRFFACLCSTAF